MDKEILIRQVALTFNGVVESPHFKKISFRTHKNKIFATLDINKKALTLKFNAINQSVFCDLGKEGVFPVPGGWGRKGWTTFMYEKLEEDILKDALTVSFNTIIEK